ncbi:MAG: Gfo/Idh/MocA family oxidoreductase [Planctomycetota bacterium]|nr:Gfo/Idh/MocA family oxidoreductase [Planctomycetota bacterium]
MSDKIRVIQVGLGGMGQGWLNNLVKNDDIEIAGVVDLREEAALAAAEKVGIDAENAHTEMSAALEKHHPDAVVDVTIPAAHREVTLTALAAGCHVIGEKPLSDSLSNAQEMVRAAEEAGKIYMVSQNYRWSKPVRAIRKAIQDGLIGKVTTANIDFYIGAHFGGFRDEMDHPLLLDMSIHHFDMLRCVTGADPRAVYCHEFNPHGSWYQGDVATTAVFEMTEGILFTYRGSWCAEGHNTGWNGIWRIIGDRGTIIWDGGDGLTAEILTDAEEGFTRPKEEVEIEKPDVGPEGLAGSLARFVSAIREGSKPETWCGDNIRSVAMVFGAVESAGRSERIEVKW